MGRVITTTVIEQEGNQGGTSGGRGSGESRSPLTTTAGAERDVQRRRPPPLREAMGDAAAVGEWQSGMLKVEARRGIRRWLGFNPLD